MILDAADAVARRNAAELAVAEATDALNSALDELKRHGFEIDQVAELLEMSPADLTGTGNPRRPMKGT